MEKQNWLKLTANLTLALALLITTLPCHSERSRGISTHVESQAYPAPSGWQPPTKIPPPTIRPPDQPTKRPPPTLQPSHVTNRSLLPLVSHQRGYAPLSLANPYLTVAPNPAHFSLSHTITLTIATSDQVTNAATIEIVTIYSPRLASLITYTAHTGHLSASGTYGDRTGYTFFWWDENSTITSPTPLYSLTFMPITQGTSSFALIYFIGDPNGARLAAGRLTAPLIVP